ncbi:Transcriptional repressor, CopY family [Candidatus Sulfopaludibacter sp. SbA3]|nr:Transcriptional repressor, CopY family [Candidatus Sulfopaludibacter sp. SbA3]
MTLTKLFVNNTYMTSKQRRPTEAELSILRVLWESGPASVRDIQRILNEIRPTGYTTVLKTMQIMTEKGLVERDESVRPQIAFGGSVKTLVLQALSTRKSSAAELEEIEKLLDRIEGGEK